MAWHKAQNDPWVWEVFEVMTGPDTGGYLIASGEHQWKEMEAWVAKMADADAADSQASMGPYIASTQRGTGPSSMPSADCPRPSTIAAHHADHLSCETGKRCGAANSHRESECRARRRQFPVRTIWFVLTNGGSSPTYAVVAPRSRPGEMAPSPSLLEILEKQLGKPAADALVKSFFDNVVSANTELLRLRTDLSYLPN